MPGPTTSGTNTGVINENTPEKTGSLGSKTNPLVDLTNSYES